MGFFSDILLTCDFDRTLTAPDSTIPESNLRALRLFMDNGGAFTVNTGRSLPMFKDQQSRVPFNAPLLLYNGAIAYDPAAGETTFVQAIDLPMAETMEQVSLLFPEMTPEVQGLHAHCSARPTPGWLAYYRNNHCRCQALAWADIPGPFIKFTLYGTFVTDTVAQFYRCSPEEDIQIQHAIHLLKRRFGNKITVERAAPRILDMQASGVSKGSAARRLARQLERPVLVCAGDGENDRSMLEAADLGFAPADSAAGLNRDFIPAAPCGQGTISDLIRRLPALLHRTPDCALAESLNNP